MSPEFDRLAQHVPELASIAAQAEADAAHDPPTCLSKLRRFAEQMARALVREELEDEPRHDEPLAQLIMRLYVSRAITDRQRIRLDALRRAGNAAVHHGRGSRAEARTQILNARRLAAWFAHTYGGVAVATASERTVFVAVSPVALRCFELEKENRELHVEIARLRALLYGLDRVA
jgi:hypothetical protein